MIDQTSYYEEKDGTYVIDSLYSSVNPNTKAAKGSGTYTNEKKVYGSSSGTLLFTYYVSGYFSWDSVADTATVSNVNKDIPYLINT